MARFLSGAAGRRANWAIPYTIFMLIFTVLPMVLIGVYAFSDGNGHFALQNFVRFFGEKETLNTFVYSIGIAIITTGLCILLGYPVAYILSDKKLNRSEVTIILFIMPMWINVLIRTLATVSLFDFLRLPLGQGALIFGMVYNYLPFMIYPIYNVLQKMDRSLVEAAQDLGATGAQVFRKVTVPLSLPGVYSGVLMVFMPTISTFAIAELLTSNNIKLFGTIIQDNINNTMWNYGAALSLIMLVIIGVTSIFSGGKEPNEQGGLI